jgi:1,4-dihydroxy-2-naphthoate octaprenyltransferase
MKGDLVTLTFNTHGCHDDTRCHKQEIVVHLASRRLAEVLFANIEGVVEACKVLLALSRIQCVENLVEVLRDVLARLLFKNVDDVFV